MSDQVILSRKEYEEIISANADYKNKISTLESQLNFFIKNFTGKTSEKYIPPHTSQLALFEVEGIAEVAETSKLKIEYERKKPGKKKLHHIEPGMRLPDHLRREELVIEPEDKHDDWQRIGEEVSEQLHYKKPELYVIKTIRPKYVLPNEGGIAIAPMPDKVKAKGMIGDTLIAHIAVEKYVYHTPLYRLSKKFEELDIGIPPNTLVDQITYISDYMKLLRSALVKVMFRSRYWMIDESPIKVLDRTKKGKTHLGYMWVYRCGITGAVLFIYKPGRRKEYPEEMIQHFNGYIQTDGYEVYESLSKKYASKFLACHAHARRKFFEAQTNDATRAKHALGIYAQLYTIEEKLRKQNATAEQRKQERQEKAVPILNEFKKWMNDQLTDKINPVTPRSSIGKAMNYLLRSWEKFMLYTEDGILEIDNNLVENVIRPLALGRKNYLFAGSHAGAERAAMMYSFYALCKVYNVPPYEWTLFVLRKINDWPVNQLEELLPMYWDRKKN